MLEDVKQTLRITNDHYDVEVRDLIESARMDLIQTGVEPSIAEEETNIDPLIKRAIITYCKANFGIDNPKSDAFMDAYVMLKQHISLSGDYNGR